jgi:hypothetical protein
LLLAGRYDEALARFDVLIRFAPTPSDAKLATELGRLAGDLRARGARIVLPSDLVDENAIARRENRRTTDEISVLYVNAVIYGLGSGGVVATYSDSREPASTILPALALGGAGAGAVALLDYGKGLGYGVPQSIVSGMYLGLAEGITWVVWNQARVAYYEEWRDRTVASVIWASATLGAIGGGVLGTVYGTTPGRASYVASTGLWSGAFIGLTTGALVTEDDHQDDSALFAAALGLNAGVIGGVFTAHDVSPTIARVRFLDLGGIAGGLVAGGIYYSAAGRRPRSRPLMGTTAIGIAGGLGLAWLFTSGMPEDRPETDRAPSGAEPFQLALMPVPGGLSLAAHGAF